MKYTAQSKKILRNMKTVAKKLGSRYIGTEHLIYALRGEFTSVAGQILAELGADEKTMYGILEECNSGFEKKDDAILEYTPHLEDVVYGAEDLARLYNEEEVGSEHILLSLIHDGDSMAARVLATMQISYQDIYSRLIDILGGEPAKIEEKSESVDFEENIAIGENLLKYGTDITVKAYQGKLDPLVGRKDEIERITLILSRRKKNNPCLIGDPGVGKSAIVEGIANNIANDNVSDVLRGKHIISIDLASLIAGTKYRGEFEERIKGLVDEARSNKNILLFIDEIHTIIGAGGGEGTMDVANILKPYLARGEIRVIGATTVDEYRKYIEKDAALERRFQPVLIEEPSEEMSIEILKGIKPHYEKFHHVEITDDAIIAAVKLSKRYITDRYLPDKAIDVLDEGCSKAKSGKINNDNKALFRDKVSIENEIKEFENERDNYLSLGDLKKASILQENINNLSKKLDKKITKRKRTKKVLVESSNIEEVVSNISHIPVSKLAEKEGKKLLNLEKNIHKRIIGQNNAVKKVSEAIRRGRVGLKDPKRPIGSFLFLGPTGVGKTELSKVLADILFGSEENIIRVDMSEYMESHSVSKMIGAPPGYVGYEEGGQLADKVRRNPYSIVLFDEMEKAHPDVFNSLLQILDDGQVTDAKGRKVDFKNTVIIMTSNVGARSIIANKKLGFDSEESEEQKQKDMEHNVMGEVKRTFRPEFLNRIDDIIVFSSLNEKELCSITNILLNDVKKRAQNESKLNVEFSPSVAKWIVKQDKSKEFGARPLKRLIQDKIENPLTDIILEGKIDETDVIKLGVRNDKIVSKVEKK